MTNKIYVAGHNGMVGSAIYRELSKNPINHIITATREELDLTDQYQVMCFFAENRIDQVYLAAAKVGGIYANNTYPADFIYENLLIQSNVINSAHKNSIQKLLFLGSSCIYPRLAEQPIHESALLTGKLENTNEPYAIAKIAGIKMCESYNRQYDRDYRSVMPTNLYGGNDNFHVENSHVIPALIRRFYDAVVSEAESVTVWGTGNPRREFLYVDDMAKASIYVMNLDENIYNHEVSSMLSHINIGTGEDCTIEELVRVIAKVTGFKGNIKFDSSKPDGSPRKLMDVSRLNNLGWRSSTSLEYGISLTYKWFLKNLENIRN